MNKTFQIVLFALKLYQQSGDERKYCHECISSTSLSPPFSSRVKLPMVHLLLCRFQSTAVPPNGSMPALSVELRLFILSDSFVNLEEEFT